MGNPIHSQNGKAAFAASDIEDVLSWTYNEGSDNPPYVSSSSGGQTLREEGNKDWTATVNVLLDDGEELFFSVGETGLLELHTSTVAAQGGKWTGEARVASIEPELDINGNAIVGASITFEANGVMTFIPTP